MAGASWTGTGGNDSYVGGYGDELPPNAALLCARTCFAVKDPSQATDLKLSLDYRGGVVVYVNGQELTRYRCDGLVVSSPTGSTAYSLAAGGAIVHPAAEVFTLTPICPHTLSNRSVILGLGDTIKVAALTATQRVIVSSDGEKCLDLAPGEAVEITRSRWKVRLVRLHGATFFDTLRCKLGWSGAHV